MASDQGAHCTGTRCGSGPVLTNSLAFPCLHHPEAADLTENGLVKIELKHQLGGNTLLGWGNISHEDA